MEGLSAAHQAWLEGRGIDLEIAVRYGLYTTERSDIGSAVVFPCRWEGRVVNRKYRALPKEFRQDKDALQAFWNADVLRDETLKGEPIVITEGEIDALSAIQAGFLRTISVPSGVNSDLSFFGELWPFIAKEPRITLAGDNDKVGKELTAELARRLGAVRCAWVDYPQGCKDLNDVLQKRGAQAVKQALEDARLYPVKGLYRLSEYPDVPVPVTFATGWGGAMDSCLQLWFPEFMVVTGIPGHGKSRWVLDLLGSMARLHHQRAVIASPEMRIVPYVRNILREHHAQCEWRNMAFEQKKAADAWIEDMFVFIDQDPREEDDDADLDWMIERAEDAVVRYGVRWFLIDPWNQVEHKRAKHESEADYQCRAIRSLKRFARSYDCGVIIIAHPTKDVKLPNGEIRKPTLYDISGSSHWYNAADHGIVVMRRNTTGNEAEISVEKSRFREGGLPGEATLRLVGGRFVSNEPARASYEDRYARA